MGITIRPIREDEVMLMTEFLYEAIFQPDTQSPLPRTVIQEPSIWVYINGFGNKKDDFCLVAKADGRIVGAVWVRCIQAFGYLDAKTPELAMSVYPQYRKKGIGTRLLQAMIAALKEKGYEKVSLSVQKGNYAAAMYQNAGFTIADENEQDYIMICKLN